MGIAEAQFDYVRRLVLERSAISLEAGKVYLVESRLAPIAREQGLSSVTELVTKLQSESLNGLHLKVVEAMTTNETSFFRDLHPFQALTKHILPELLTSRAPTRELNVWFAACSTGQEPYSVGMLIHEQFQALLNWKLKFIATDISGSVLEKARKATYGQIELNRGLPAPMLVKYFARQGMLWQLNENIRRMVDFREMNLASPWPFMPSMDIVFLRNVLIYFKIETKKDILRRVKQLLRPDGFLFLGGAETTLNLDSSFERVKYGRSVCYRVHKETSRMPKSVAS